jgi:RsiW-degrading membrane proteinase PrsW (M82 family)
MARQRNGTEALAGLAAPDRTSRTALLAVFGGVITLLGLCAGLCAGVSSADAFLANPLVGILAAFTAMLCGAPYLFMILWIDRNESEPWWMILGALAWGAIFATGWSLFVNDTFMTLTYQIVGNADLAHQIGASLSAPFIEESTKGLGLVVLYAFFRRHFDNVLDGVVYGALIGLGFAVFENFMYYAQTHEVVGVLGLTLVRGVLTAVGSHPAFTALTGVGFGLARVLRRGFLRWLLPPLFLAGAMFVHFSWNTFTGLFMTDNALANLFIALPMAVTVLQLPNVCLILSLAGLALWHEGRMIRKYLANEASLEDGELDRLVPAWRRGLHALKLLLTLQLGAWWRARTRTRLLVKLAFERWHMDQEAEDDPTTAREHARAVQGLRERLART